MYTLKMGASSAGRGMENSYIFKSYDDAGIEYMEVSSRPHEYENYDWDEVKKACEGSKTKIWSLHTPFHPDTHNIANMNKEIRDFTIECYKDLFYKAAYLGAKYVIVHPSSEPISDEERPFAIKYAKESLSVLAKEAKKAGIVIAVENLPRTCLGNTVEELMDIISVDDSLVICFDVNHLLKQTHKHFVSVAGSKIKTLHISDYDFIDERHLLPGEGKIDWKEILDLLEGIGYDGAFMYEVSLQADGDEGKYPTVSRAKENYFNVMERKI